MSFNQKSSCWLTFGQCNKFVMQSIDQIVSLFVLCWPNVFQSNIIWLTDIWPMLFVLFDQMTWSWTWDWPDSRLNVFWPIDAEPTLVPGWGRRSGCSPRRWSGSSCRKSHSDIGNWNGKLELSKLHFTRRNLIWVCWTQVRLKSHKSVT